MLVTSGVFLVGGQNNLNYWQQRVNYKMDVVMDVRSNSYSGTQNLIYNNNSPDDLSVVFYHLYYNAFQPGSEMDVRSNTISDPELREGNRQYLEGEYSKAAKILIPYIEEHPNDASAHSILSACFFRLGDLDQAIKAAEILAQKKIFAKVINMHTIKPLDKSIIKESLDSSLIVSI